MKLQELITEISNKKKVDAISVSVADETMAKNMTKDFSRIRRELVDLNDKIRNNKGFMKFVTSRPDRDLLITQPVDMKELDKAISTMTVFEDRLSDLAFVRRGQAKRIAKKVK